MVMELVMWNCTIHYAEFTIEIWELVVVRAVSTLVVVVALQGVDCLLVADSCLINTIKENNKTATDWMSQ